MSEQRARVRHDEIVVDAQMHTTVGVTVKKEPDGSHYAVIDGRKVRVTKDRGNLAWIRVSDIKKMLRFRGPRPV